MSFIGTKLGVNSGPSFCKLPFLLLPCKQCVLARRHTHTHNDSKRAFPTANVPPHLVLSVSHCLFL